ncbi:pyridoxamine 5'-phosphate oxidase family protein [Phenylobacterium sp.]|uniref:pyridoxamine 5'-phosphate oxidase family protein n=1 Tax=Phenylobacterium sp. TaxID=1871053 RepID=UPI00289B15C9|nr:pyridoxamine 5'-phosphate oxidase family protein [Phenylobacterium sp.]
MNIDMNDRAAVERKLWDDIERHQVGMLGLAGESALQPMTAFVEREGERLWFFTGADTELARQIGEGRQGLFVFQHRELQACITGEMTLQHDEARIAKYWNAVVAAWRPQGKDDPRLTLICLDCRDADVWCSQTGPVTFAWEIAMANARKHEPHLGGRANLHFH